MSAILGVFGAPEPVDDGVVDRMLARMRARGVERTGVWRDASVALAAGRHAWECGDAFSGDAFVVRDGDLAIAADASLYYRAELEQRLTAAGVCVCGSTPSHLILAAYRAWGRHCLQFLEGDYAFILWDAGVRRALSARDFAGTRPLFFAEVGSTLVVASTSSALLAHPGCSDDFNLNFLAECTSSLWLPERETAYSNIRAIPAGFMLTHSHNGSSLLTRHWRPPATDSQDHPPFDEAAAELRDRVRTATAERLSPHGTTTVFMSGGRDSPAVFASGQDALNQHANGKCLTPISISYPSGDLGREDEFITAIAQFWGAPIHWLDIRDIPFFERADEYAAQRDEPWALPYHAFNRALAKASARIGAHVALDGWGGDQLFQMSPVHLADLFRAGRWMALAREWRALKVSDWRFFFRMTIAPVLPAGLRRAAKLLRGGRPIPGWADGWVPEWVRPPFVKALRERQQSYNGGHPTASFATDELYLFLTSAMFSRGRGWLSALALSENVEIRSPLFDARVIELAVRRPVSERRVGRDTKFLLRAALRDLLPQDVLASRPQRTGVTANYLRDSMQDLYPALLRRVLRAPVRLAELGIIEPEVWRRAAERCLSSAWSDDVAMALCHTVHAELWLRARQQDWNTMMVNAWPSFRASRPISPLTMEVQRV